MRKTLRMLLLALVALGSVAALPAVASAEPTTMTAPARTQARALTKAEAVSLSERQDRARGLQRYEGGQVAIAISTVGAIVIALVILLLVL